MKIHEILTEREANIHSPEFRHWFGNSKVVDAHGQPLVVYHGTMFDFDSFSPGSHFGDIEAANTRLKNTEKEPNIFRHNLGFVMPVYLSIRNPLRIVDTGSEHTGYHLAQVVLNMEIITRDQYNEICNTGSAGVAKRRLFYVLGRGRQGYDGFVYKNTVEGKGDSWIPFWANQVKSVFNNGAWSKDDNINEGD